MTPNPTKERQKVEQIVGRLSEKQRLYIIAVFEAGGEYKPRHGRTAFWALSEGITDTVLHYESGLTAVWGDPDRPTMQPFSVGGQVLTTLGLAVRSFIQENGM